MSSHTQNNMTLARLFAYDHPAVCLFQGLIWYSHEKLTKIFRP